MTDEVDRPYAGQEGEINDKLLLDLAWERQQKKVAYLVASWLRMWGGLRVHACKTELAAPAAASCCLSLSRKRNSLCAERARVRGRACGAVQPRLAGVNCSTCGEPATFISVSHLVTCAYSSCIVEKYAFYTKALLCSV